MAPCRPPLSRTVLADLARKVHEDDASNSYNPALHPALASFQQWAILVCGAGWICLLAAAPVLLGLLIIGVNLTGRWLVAAMWLLGLSFVLAGAMLIAKWIYFAFSRKKPSYGSLLLGITLILGTASAGVVLWYGPGNDRHPLLTLGATTLLAALFIGGGVYRIVATRQTPLLSRLFFFLATICFAGSMIVHAISLQKQLFDISPDIYRTIQPVGVFFRL